MPERKGMIFVSRKGTASNDIDADPAFRAIYQARAERRRAGRRRVAQWIVLGLAVVVGIAAYMLTGFLVGR